LRINDLPYNQSSYNPKEFSGPEVIMLRLDVSGLESIRIWKEGENGTMMPGALYAGHACAGIKGFSGFCSDLEARHSTKLRLSPPVDIADLVRRNFHETATPIVQYGFDVTEPPTSPTTESPQSQNKTESKRPKTPTRTLNSTTGSRCLMRKLTLQQSREKMQELGEKIKQRLYINTRATSAFVRSKTSAEDLRYSSQTIGAVALSFLCLVGILVVLPDAMALVRWITRRYA
ncbi:hypothetical protein ElyMa_005429200, partial [Elysia marginata]